jgi:hypothetical protein
MTKPTLNKCDIGTPNGGESLRTDTQCQSSDSDLACNSGSTPVHNDVGSAPVSKASG